MPLSSSVGYAQQEVPSPDTSTMASTQWLTDFPLENGKNLCQDSHRPLLSPHLRYRRFDLGQPEGHVHGAV
jgi:hypothetical protein